MEFTQFLENINSKDDMKRDHWILATSALVNYCKISFSKRHTTLRQVERKSKICFNSIQKYTFITLSMMYLAYKYETKSDIIMIKKKKVNILIITNKISI